MLATSIFLSKGSSMTTEKNQLTKDEIMQLKARWNKEVPEGGKSLKDQMVDRLKNECRKSNAERPLKLDLRGIILYHEELSNLDLSGYDLSYASLNKCNLTSSNLSYTNCHQTGMEHAVLDECEFIGSNLTHASLNECSAKQSGFGGADLTYASMISADLTEATLSRSTLSHADLRAANLTDARLSEADLTHSVFTRARLVKSDLKHSDVQGASFEVADMRECRLLGIVNFKKAIWIGTDIRDIDLRGAYLVRRHIADENYLYEFQARSKYHRVIYLAWWFFSDCGRSLTRWFLWLLVVTLMFAGIYTQLEIDYGDHPTVFSPIYFSFVTLTTLGYGDSVPASIPGQIFVTLQAVSGYMGLGGLLSILGNKMARRAE